MSKEIKLGVPEGFPTNLPQIAIVSDEDYEYLNQFAWIAKASDGSETKYHAVRNVTVGGRPITIRMHRLIAEARHDQIVYHIDDDTLNNSRGNLQTRTIHPWTGRPNGAGYRGVHQMSASRWRSEISFAGHRYTIGDEFADAAIAAKAYDSAAVKLFGTNAITNFDSDAPVRTRVAA